MTLLSPYIRNVRCIYLHPSDDTFSWRRVWCSQPQSERVYKRYIRNEFHSGVCRHTPSTFRHLNIRKWNGEHSQILCELCDLNLMFILLNACITKFRLVEISFGKFHILKGFNIKMNEFTTIQWMLVLC